MKIVVVKIVFVFLFCFTFSMNVFAQTNDNVKSTGIKAGIVFPIGDLSDNYGIGFMVADLTKWYLSGNVRAVGRMELTFLGGKEITEVLYPGYSYTHTTSPIGILTAGIGFEFFLEPKGGFYGILDFPSMNIIMAGSGFRVGFGIGFGYEFSWSKAVLGLEARYNLYNALLAQTTEQSQAALQVGLEIAF
jgi:hypothetical protein